MSGFSNYLQSAVLNWLKGTAMPTAPAAVYVALFNGDPTDAGSGGTEVTTTIRAVGRVAVTFGSVSGSTSMSNNADVDFGAAAGAAEVTHFAIYSAASAGNMLGSNALAAPQNVASGNPVKFAAGALTVSVT